MMTAHCTRREFFRLTMGTAIAATGASVFGEAWAQPTAKVVLIRHADVVGEQAKINGAIVQTMLDEAVQTLVGAGNPADAWRALIRPTDVVGIKSNAWERLPTPVEVEAAIRRRVVDAGVQESRLDVADRGVLQNPIFRNATALVNVRPLRTHHWAGVGTCLKNYIQFVPDRPAYHPDGCAALGQIWTLPAVKGKTRLNILSALTPQFYGRGANFFDRRYVWPYQGLIVGTDPVAVDTVGAHLLQAKRVAFFGEDRALDVTPHHIQLADTKYGLGVSDLARIEVVKLGWMDGVLI
ncbi:MAG TPA: DUF362 domain-containing protein [Candidatus Baltobacteraceae bacterium]|nr:DUF362 domain-containing protein [Candidatus Baltobacteraceae bacterium]